MAFEPDPSLASRRVRFSQSRCNVVPSATVTPKTSLNTNEVVCAPGVVAAKTLQPVVQSAGTRRMIERLDPIRSQSLAQPEQSAYWSAELVKFFRREMAAPPTLLISSMPAWNLPSTCFELAKAKPLCASLRVSSRTLPRLAQNRRAAAEPVADAPGLVSSANRGTGELPDQSHQRILPRSHPGGGVHKLQRGSRAPLRF